MLSWVPQGWGGDVSSVILRLGTWSVWDLEKCPTEGSSHGRGIWLGSAGPGRRQGLALALWLCSQCAGPGQEGSPENSNLLTLGTVSRIRIVRMIRTLLAAKDKRPTQMSLRIKERKPGREKGGREEGHREETAERLVAKDPRGAGCRSRCIQGSCYHSGRSVSLLLGSPPFYICLFLRVGTSSPGFRPVPLTPGDPELLSRQPGKSVESAMLRLARPDLWGPGMRAEKGETAEESAVSSLKGGNDGHGARSKPGFLASGSASCGLCLGRAALLLPFRMRQEAQRVSRLPPGL